MAKRVHVFWSWTNIWKGFPFLPEAKPSGLRTVRVVVVNVVFVGGGKQFDDLLQDLLLSSSPTLNFLRGGILGSYTRFLFGVGSVTQKSDFYLGWDPLMACSLCNSVYFFAIFLNMVILSIPQVLEQSLFLFHRRLEAWRAWMSSTRKCWSEEGKKASLGSPQNSISTGQLNFTRAIDCMDEFLTRMRDSSSLPK